MYGLKMRKEYYLEILSGKKNTDARLYDTGVRGEIAIIDSENNKIVGFCNLYDTAKVTYEEYVMWHVNDTSYSLNDAKSCIDDTDFIKLKSPAFFYLLSNVRKAEDSLIVTPINDGKAFIEFDLESALKGYKQQSLF